jgi:NADPH2:quinone reductase
MCRELTGIAALRLEEVPPLPPPGQHEVRVALKAAGLNFPDLLMTTGRYQFKPPVPFIPGMEAAGEVVELGPGVTRWRLGQRVVARVPSHGGLAEEAVLAEDKLHALPNAFSFAEGACFHIGAATATHAVMQRGALQAGETLLVHGAGGGVGLAAVEVGKLLGATVIAVCGGVEKAAVVRAKGADHVIDHQTESFRNRVMELTGGRGADVVFDPVGGDTFDASLRCMAWEGRILVVGFAGGRIQTIPGNQPLLKGISVVGVRALEHLVRNPAGGAAYEAWMYAQAEQGRLRPHLSATLPLDRFAEALELLESRRAIGRVAVEIA